MNPLIIPEAFDLSDTDLTVSNLENKSPEGRRMRLIDLRAVCDFFSVANLRSERNV